MAVTLESLDAKLDMLCQDVGELKTRLTGLNRNLREHDRAITRLEERQTIGSMLQGAFSAALAAIAAYLGIKN